MCAALLGVLAALICGLAATSASAAALTIKTKPGAPFRGELAAVQLESTEGVECAANAHEATGLIVWGDGAETELTEAKFVLAGEQAVHLFGAHTYAHAGEYQGRITGSYKCRNNTIQRYEAKFSGLVTSVFGETTGVEFMETVSGVTATQCSQNSSNPVGTIEWGDGTSSAATITPSGDLGTYLVAGSHTYSKPGVYQGRFTGSYKCQQGTGTGEFEAASFTAEVTGAERTAPPPPPPAVHASFGVQSVAPGKAVLDAAASTPAGASAATYSWNVTGGAQPDAVCQGSEPTLTVQTQAALNTNVSLTATDAATGASTVVSEQLHIPAPTKPALTGKIARAASSAQRVSVKGAVTPAFKMIGTCTGPGLPYSPDATYRSVAGFKSGFQTTFGGVPPPECLEETEFGAIDVQGCLASVPNLEEIPGGITVGLAKMLCGTKLQAFCMEPLSALGGTLVSAVTARESSRARARAAANVPLARGLVEKALADMKFPFYFSTQAIRIDGLDLDPQNGSPIVVVPGADLVFGQNVKVYLHDIPLVTLPVLILHLPDLGGPMGELKLPKSVPIIGSLPFTGSIGISLHKAGTKLSNGDTCAFDCAAMAVNLELPDLFTGADGKGLNAGAVITADDQEGLELSSFEVDVPRANLGGIGVENVEFRYLHSNDSLHGGATVDLGPVGDIGGSVDFIHGHFNGASLNYSAGDGPGIDLGGPLNIYLTELGGGFTVEPPVIEAHGEITGGPQTLGCSLLGINAELVIRLEPEFALDASGTGSLLCQSVASEYFHIDGGGHIGLGAHIHLHFLVFALEGGIDFDAEPEHGHFQADANISACIELFGEHCLSAEAVISDRGIGVCADLGFTHAGGGIQFPDNGILFYDSCDIGKFRSLGFVTGVHGHGATSENFTVPKGQKVALIGLPGSGGPPKATLTGPSGRTIKTPAAGYEKTADYVVISDNKSATKETYFFINHPEPGAWKVTPEAGSPAITSIEQAGQLPAPKVKGRVSRAGGGRDRLSYSLNPIPGQHVTFAEREASGAFHEIGSAKGRRGTLVFTPSSNLGRSRSMEAMVTQEGHPREDAVITHFKVAPPTLLPAPKRLRIVRRGATVKISFGAVAGASGYGLTVRLADGRTIYLKLAPRRHDATIAAVPSNIGAKVTVGAIMPGLRVKEGRTASARLKLGAKPKPTVVIPLRS
ncbi:MAG TPA: hypothetical protein VH061_09020 [Solirubrobacteraceae bacterium]|jgi:hypothetical protein|nr:hypothetical protein [Solirubrobacteraceae bacterium]